MKHLSRFRFTWFRLIALCLLSQLVGLVVTLMVSSGSSDQVVRDIRSRELETLFAAVESGPLVLSKLHAQEIAQEQLDRLMSSKSFEQRGFSSVEIRGGEANSDRYAIWSDRSVEPSCVKIAERTVSIPGSLYPFSVRIGTDQCGKIVEADRWDQIQMFCLLGIFGLEIVIFVAMFYPVVRSIRAGETLLTYGNADRGFDQIILEPVRKLTEVALKAKRLERDSALAQLAQQVAHDIRSPLAALGMIERDLDGVDKDNRLLVRGAIGRIRDIANSLLNQNRPSDSRESAPVAFEPVSRLDLSKILEEIVREKRLQFRDQPRVELAVSIERGAYACFSQVQPIEFGRVISNLINNAVEALRGSGQVRVYLSATSETCRIVIEDNGCGIPADVLPRLTQRGGSFGKSAGSGLGLYHAKGFAEQMGGTLRIESEPGQMTRVTLLVPRVDVSDNVVTEICLVAKRHVVTIDDDASVHAAWRRRIEKAGYEVQLVSFQSLGEFKQWLKQSPMAWGDATYLFDYELSGESETGLDVIEALGLEKQSFLVTGQAEDKSVRMRCEKLGVQVVAKMDLGQVPISIISEPALA